MIRIKLGNGGYALIDSSDFNLVSKYNWYKVLDGNTHYVYTNTRIDGKCSTLKMHRLITNADKKEHVDHINKNGLDNQKSNLRRCSPLVNSWNSDYNYHPYFSKEHNKYRARVKVNNKDILFGYLKSRENVITILTKANDIKKQYINNTINLKQLNDKLNKLRLKTHKLRIEEGGKKTFPPKYKIFLEKDIK